jgi:hypothetical protein
MGDRRAFATDGTTLRYGHRVDECQGVYMPPCKGDARTWSAETRHFHYLNQLTIWGYTASAVE